MAKGATRRPPTEEELSPSDREIYEALPDHLRERYLKRLPPISISTQGNRKKAQLVRDRLVILDNVLNELQNHRRELAQLAKNLDAGTVSATHVDLRTRLKPPAIRGVSMRYVRRKE
jgi:hypothetical protein